jgi:MYXO-CTERM domain-containing protein
MGTTTIQVTKGAPCGSAADCAAGQQCEAGKCFWTEPTGELGDPCTYPQFCLSLNCQGPSATELVCTQGCIPNVGDSCPIDFQCLPTGPSTGICYPGSPDDGGGCCSSSSAGAAGSALLALGLLVVLAPRRRRRRR